MLDERLQVRAADLFLALDEELDARRIAASDGPHGAHRRDTRDDLSLVVRDAARVEAAIALGQRSKGGDSHSSSGSSGCTS